MNAESEMIIEGHITSANVPNINSLEGVVNESNTPKGATIMIDKGYSSKQNQHLLKIKSYKDRNMIKCSTNKGFSVRVKKINKK